MRAIVAAALSLSACYAGAEPGDDAVRDGSLPDIPYCDPARAWPGDWEFGEARALELIDDLREHGADCGVEGRGSTAPTLRVHGALTCAARIHAIAMAEQAQVGHTTPDEVGTEQRVDAVGYEGKVIEHIAAGPLTGAEVFDIWRRSDRHCIDLLSRAHSDVGIGFVGDTEEGDAYASYWAILIGKPSGP